MFGSMLLQCPEGASYANDGNLVLLVGHENDNGDTLGYKLRCNEIATLIFFQTFFRRFLGIIEVTRLAMCYISKCSAGSVVFFTSQ